MAATQLVHATDEALIEAVKRGDSSAFGILADRHRRTLTVFFARQLWDFNAAEDGAQDVLLKLFRFLGRYEARARFTTFLITVARNHGIDRLRARRTAPRTVSFDDSDGCDLAGVADRLEGDEPPPDDIASDHERTAELRRAISALPEDQRAVLCLAAFEGLAYHRIARRLAIPLGTVKSRMHTALGRMRALMAVGA
jgi:RNA polymerase sigma-70 factor (ECF subfamily)